MPCHVPGAELAAFVLLAAVVCPSHELGALTLVFSLVSPFALLFSPALFNPHCFNFRLIVADSLQFAKWLVCAPPYLRTT